MCDRAAWSWLSFENFYHGIPREDEYEEERRRTGRRRGR